MILGSIYWLLGTLFIMTLSYLLLPLFRSERKALNLLYFLFLNIFLITLLLMIVGYAGLLKPVPIALVSVFGLITFCAVPATRSALLDFPTQARDFLRAGCDWWDGLPSWLRIFTAVLTVFSVVRFTFLILTLVPFVWDSLTYHLTNVAHWTQQGRIELFETSMSRIYTPANYELFVTWYTVFLHHDVVIEAAGLPVYILAIVAVYATSRGLGYSTTASWLGALAYGSMPGLLLSTTGTKNDPHIAAYFISALAVIVELVQQRTQDRKYNSLGHLIMLALILLLALGTKIYIASILPGLILIAFLGGRLRGRWRLWLNHLREAFCQFRKRTSIIKLVFLAIIIGGLFLGLFWNVRNWILEGNPFYPYSLSIEYERIIGDTDKFFPLSLGRLRGNLESLVYKFGDKRAPIRPDLTDTTGWGWFVFCIGVPAVLWSLIRKPMIRNMIFGFILSLLVLFLSDRPSPWNMRYVIWFPAIFSFAFVALYDWLPKKIPAILISMNLLLGLTIVLNLAMNLNYNIVTVERFEKMLSIPLLQRQTAHLKINIPGEYENAIDYVPPDEVLGYDTHDNGFIYPLYRADLSQQLVHVPISSSDTCEQIAQKMRDRGTRWIFVAPEHSVDQHIALLRACSDSDTSIRERARGVYVID